MLWHSAAGVAGIRDEQCSSMQSESVVLICCCSLFVGFSDQFGDDITKHYIDDNHTQRTTSLHMG